MASSPIDPRLVSKMRARAKDLRRDQPDLKHAQLLDLVAREQGFATWKHVARSAESQGLMPVIDDPQARRLLARAQHLGASAIHISVKQRVADVRIRVHGLLVDHESIEPAAVDELVEACPDTASASIVGGTVHVVHLPRQQLTWSDMNPGKHGPVARQVVEWWATNPKPGVLLVSSRGTDPVHISEPLLKYAKAKARSGAWKVTELRSGSESDALVVNPNLKTIVPMRASDSKGSVMRALLRELPPAMLAGDRVFSVCVHVEALPRLCPHCAVAPREGERNREMVEGLRSFVARLPRSAQLRQLGKGCSRCNGIGTVGIRHLFEGHGITELTVEAAAARNWSNPGWMETIDGNFSQGKIVTASDLAADAAAAGEIDVFAVFEHGLEDRRA